MRKQAAGDKAEREHGEARGESLDYHSKELKFILGTVQTMKASSK